MCKLIRIDLGHLFAEEFDTYMTPLTQFTSFYINDSSYRPEFLRTIQFHLELAENYVVLLFGADLTIFLHGKNMLFCNMLLLFINDVFL